MSSDTEDDDDHPSTHFQSFGGFWLDEIRRPVGEPLTDVPGGSVVFATLGARLFSASRPHTIALAIRAGGYLPSHVEETLFSWGVWLIVQRERDRPPPRGIVHYGSIDAPRGYERLTPPLNITPQNLPDGMFFRLQHSRLPAFHFFDTPSNLKAQLVGERPLGLGKLPISSLIIWEPQVRACVPELLNDHQRAAELVDVFSPNHGELAKLFGRSQSDVFSRAEVEEQAKMFLSAVNNTRNLPFCVVVRAGEHGCLVSNEDMAPVWLPAYYSSTSSMVVDTTGAGNAFLGGFAVGLRSTGDHVEAAIYGTVAASFVVEQVGLPQRALCYGENGRCTIDKITERWNDQSVDSRLELYRQRLLQSV